MASPMLSPTRVPDAADPRPIYILLAFAVLLNAYFFFLGTVCVRLWFYKGSLGPEPEKFIILRKGHKERYRISVTPGASESKQEITTSVTRPNRHSTPCASAARPQDSDYDISRIQKSNQILDPTVFTPHPKLNIHDPTSHTNLTSPTLLAYIKEEQRISRLPTFVQDDCGDGSDFPNVAIANTPIEEASHPFTITSAPDTQASTNTNSQDATIRALGLVPTPATDWLLLDNEYIPQHTARTALLATQHADCIQTTREGEAACEELLEEVVGFLVSRYPQHFCVRMKGTRRHVQNEVTGEEFALGRPGALEVVARLCGEDFLVWGRGEFTRGWYL
ncbi:hypothetical protein J1614_006947 [Plenodomus biglobosus]|nr:hypothetical protein J1614_006947 [Plenodomus biglobosus]